MQKIEREVSALSWKSRFATLPRMMNASMHAALFAKPVVWSWRLIVSGMYGEPIRRGGRSVWVSIAAVEAAEGVKFSPAQLAAVGLRIPEHSQEVA